jgi:serine protease Do
MLLSPVAIAARALFLAVAFAFALGVAPADALANTANAAQLNARQLPDFSTLVEKQSAAVVNISTSRGTARMQLPQGAPSEPMPDFFRRFPPFANGQPQTGVGSGFIISPDGYLLTNAHVVAETDEVTVRLKDKREYKARVVGFDKRTDVAVLKIDAKGLPVVEIGNTERLRVGEWVAAIGSPYGFESTVTAGIVSAKSRALPDDSYVPFIQTDVAINPGNSGGPLFNLDGEVIGINSQIYSRSGGYQGLSFAIPIEVAMRVKDDLVKHGRVQRGRIGVSIQAISKDLAESFGLEKPMGALVNAVDAGGPADKAGIKAGDIIMSVEGKKIEQSVELPRAIGEAKPGQTLRLAVFRKGETRDIAVAIGEMPAERTAKAPARAVPGEKQGRLGVAVRPLTPEERKRIDADGVVVEQVDGAAARAGVQPGDIILALNDQPIESVEQLKKIVEQSKERAALLVQRNGSRIFVPVRLS